MKVNLKSITPAAEVNIVEIARVSSPRQDKKEKPEGLINYLIKNNHWSPLEHSYMTIEIETSKAIGIQLLRHRSFTFQEFSQRYAKAAGYEDVELRIQAEKNRQSSTTVIGLIESDVRPEGADIDDSILFDKMRRCMNYAFELYEEAIGRGIAKECARMILPMATSTTIYMTGSIRSWVHFLSIRDDEHAQKEIQLIAKEIKQIFCKELPIISKALGYVTSKEI
jgi:thymidylate synthase (FAD)